MIRVPESNSFSPKALAIQGFIKYLLPESARVQYDPPLTEADLRQQRGFFSEEQIKQALAKHQPITAIDEQALRTTLGVMDVPTSKIDTVISEVKKLAEKLRNLFSGIEDVPEKIKETVEHVQGLWLKFLSKKSGNEELTNTAYSTTLLSDWPFVLAKYLDS